MLSTSTSCKTKVIPAAAGQDAKRGRVGEHLRIPRCLQGSEGRGTGMLGGGDDYMVLMLTAPTKQILKPNLAIRMKTEPANNVTQQNPSSRF